MIDFYELLEDYKEGKLSKEDTFKFEEELARNEKLQIDLNNYSLAKKLSSSLIELVTRDECW